MTTTPLEHNELACLGALVVSTATFTVYAVAAGVPGTLEYLVSVGTVATLILGLRRTFLPTSLTVALVGLAVAHLAGGLVRVGDGVLYNASLGSPAFQYDHFVHSAGVMIGTLVLWTLFVAPATPSPRRRDLVAISVLAGLGLGAVNEMIEFLATLAHGGAHVGGYANTGWDLVSNLVGGLAAGFVLRRTGSPVSPRPSPFGRPA